MPRRPDTRRQTKPWRALYDSTRWQSLRRDRLAAHPLCDACLAQAHTTPATVVHHKIRHNGDEALFFRGPFESLCKSCHDRLGAEDDSRGYQSVMTGPDGFPIDERHPFNSGAPMVRRNKSRNRG